jgi:hypothetical protein
MKRSRAGSSMVEAEAISAVGRTLSAKLPTAFAVGAVVEVVRGRIVGSLPER